MIFEALQNKIYNGIERKKYKLIQYRRYKNKKKVYVIFGCYCKLLHPNGIKGYKRLPLNLFDSNHSDLLIVIFNKNWITKKQCFDNMSSRSSGDGSEMLFKWFNKEISSTE